MFIQNSMLLAMMALGTYSSNSTVQSTGASPPENQRWDVPIVPPCPACESNGRGCKECMRAGLSWEHCLQTNPFPKIQHLETLRRRIEAEILKPECKEQNPDYDTSPFINSQLLDDPVNVLCKKYNQAIKFVVHLSDLNKISDTPLPYEDWMATAVEEVSKLSFTFSIEQSCRWRKCDCGGKLRKPSKCKKCVNGSGNVRNNEDFRKAKAALHKAMMKYEKKLARRTERFRAKAAEKAHLLETAAEKAQRKANRKTEREERSLRREEHNRRKEMRRVARAERKQAQGNFCVDDRITILKGKHTGRTGTIDKWILSEKKWGIRLDDIRVRDRIEIKMNPDDNTSWNPDYKTQLGYILRETRKPDGRMQYRVRRIVDGKRVKKTIDDHQILGSLCKLDTSDLQLQGPAPSVSLEPIKKPEEKETPPPAAGRGAASSPQGVDSPDSVAVSIESSDTDYSYIESTSADYEGDELWEYSASTDPVDFKDSFGNLCSDDLETKGHALPAMTRQHSNHRGGVQINDRVSRQCNIPDLPESGSKDPRLNMAQMNRQQSQHSRDSGVIISKNSTQEYPDLDFRRRLADIEAPHGLFIFAPILMFLMLVYLILRKPAAKWNSASSSRSDHSASTEKTSAKYQ